MRSFLFLTFFLIIKISAVAQKYAISGIITDSISGEGLNSATIRSSSNNNFFLQIDTASSPISLLAIMIQY